MPQPLGKQPALDGVRALAIAAVIALHVAVDKFPGGFIGVDVFFTLSAFLITSLMIDEVAARGAFSFRSFYARRALRLGPALLVWLAVITPIAAATFGEAHRIPASTGIVITYLTDFAMAGGGWGLSGAYGHGWSLAVEEQFYLVWPALLLLLARRAHGSAPRLLGLGLVMAAAAFVGSIAVVGTGPTYFLPWGHGVPLAAGCAAAVLRARGIPKWLGRVTGHTPFVATLTIGMVVLVVAYRSMLYIPTTIAVGLITALLLLHLCSRPASVVSSIFAFAPLRWIGKRSYGYYLYTLTLLGVLPALDHGFQLRYNAPVTLLATTILVAASFRYIEQPFLRRKARFEPITAAEQGIARPGASPAAATAG